LLARATSPSSPQVDPTPVALVVLRDEIRVDAADTLRYLRAQGVEVKVLSGDHPKTVAAVAAEVGLPPGEPIDARTLDGAPPDTVTAALDEHTVFGRVTPDQKRAFVDALRAGGHVVAMTGDGINDVLALKNADVGIAMGAGSPATRAVAQLVLLDNAFTAVPDVIAEGRRVISNMERVANLFERWREGDGVDRKIPPRQIIIQRRTKLHLGMTAIGSHVAAKGRDLMHRSVTVDHAYRAEVDADRNRTPFSEQLDHLRRRCRCRQIPV